jgi:hypothetical protein
VFERVWRSLTRGERVLVSWDTEPPPLTINQSSQTEIVALSDLGQLSDLEDVITRRREGGEWYDIALELDVVGNEPANGGWPQ